MLNLSCTRDIYTRGFAKFRDELADCVYFNVSSTVGNYVNLCSHRCHNRECYEALMKINDANILDVDIILSTENYFPTIVPFESLPARFNFL